LPRSLLSLLLVFAVLFGSALPAVACADDGCREDDCGDARGALHEDSEDHGDDAPSCPPSCSVCPCAAPVVTAGPVLAIVVIPDLATQATVFVAPMRLENPPSDGVFHPPRRSV